MKLLLILQHEEYANHRETWFLNSDDQVFVDFNCPQNYPPKGSHTLTPVEAMRNYILMVSDEEGWWVVQDNGFRDYVERVGLGLTE